jgi:hypothetical protein
MKIRLLLFILLPILIINCGQRSNVVTNVDGFEEEYPTVIYPKDPTILQGLNSNFHAVNPGICTDLNAYGFTGIDNECRGYRGEGLDQDHFDTEFMIQKAKQFIVFNSQFTNVSDTMVLKAKSWRLQYNFFQIRFEEQINKNLPVIGYNTAINIIMDSLGIFYITGHWYRYINIPAVDRVTKDEAKENIIGLEIPWYSYDGSSNIYIVEEDDLRNPITRVILPIHADKSITLRVVWKIPVLTRWHVYLDTTTGNIVLISQEFVTGA